MTPIASLLVAPTAASVRASLVSGLTSLGIPAGNWRSGGVASSLLTAVSNTYANGLGLLVNGVLNGVFLTTAQPPWNAILAYYMYGVQVGLGTYASGFVYLSNTTGSIYSKGANQVIVQNPTTGQEYFVTQPFTLNGGTILSPTTIGPLPVQALNLGAAGTSAAGTITYVVSALVGVSVTNPAPVVGTAPDPPALVVTKCLAAIAARSYKGPNGAYQNAVLTAINSSGNPVNINRWTVSTDPNTGFCTIYVAAPSGVPTAADVAAVQANVQAIAQPPGITATVVACTVVDLGSIIASITAWYSGAGTTQNATIVNEAATALANGLATWPIGGVIGPGAIASQGYVYINWLVGIITAADPTIVDVTLKNSSLAEVDNDIALSAGQVAQFLTPNILAQLAQN